MTEQMWDGWQGLGMGGTSGCGGSDAQSEDRSDLQCGHLGLCPMSGGSAHRAPSVWWLLSVRSHRVRGWKPGQPSRVSSFPWQEAPLYCPHPQPRPAGASSAQFSARQVISHKVN